MFPNFTLFLLFPLSFFLLLIFNLIYSHFSSFIPLLLGFSSFSSFSFFPTHQFFVSLPGGGECNIYIPEPIHTEIFLFPNNFIVHIWRRQNFVELLFENLDHRIRKHDAEADPRKLPKMFSRKWQKVQVGGTTELWAYKLIFINIWENIHVCISPLKCLYWRLVFW